jgi:hypothetical protein
MLSDTLLNYVMLCANDVKLSVDIPSVILPNVVLNFRQSFAILSYIFVALYNAECLYDNC